MWKTCVFWAKYGLVCLMILARTLNPGSAAAQSTNPLGLPLLASDGLQYVGAFRLPAASANGDSFSFGGGAVAFNPAGNSLFVSSYSGNVAEVTIPSPVNSSDVNALPFATFLQPFADPTEGHLSDISGVGVNVAGLMVYGSRLYGTASIFYDANNSQTVSHFSRSLQLNQPSFAGWSQVWDAGRTGFVAGWMSVVPSEWQALLGGAALTGQCCIPIVWRTSSGPAAIAFNPAQVGQATVSATPLLYYTQEHSTLGPWEGSNPTYGAATMMGGVAVIAGTRTALYVGRNGLGPFCYGNGTANQSLHGTYGPDGAMWCYDPTSSDKGNHAYPYRYQIWAYDLNDFAAVKAGAKQPWEVVPYGVWPLNLPTPEPTTRVGGVAYDAQRQLLYISQRWADPDNYSSRPVIHVFRVNATPGAVTAPATNTVSQVTLTADKTAPQPAGTAVTFTAQPTGGVTPYQYKWLIWDGVTSTVAANWTTSNRFTWTPSTASANYRLTVWVRSAGNTADVLEATTSMPFAIDPATTSGKVTSVTLTANRVAPQPPLTAITWTSTTTGGVAPLQYKWLVSDGTTTKVAADWSTTNSFVWTPPTNANYRVTVWAKGSGNTADQAEASADQSFAITTAPTTSTAPSVVSHVTISSDKPSPISTGTAVVLTAQAFGGTAPHEYQWWVFDGQRWTAVAGWSTANKFTWTPNKPDPKYQVGVWARSAGSTNDRGDATINMAFVVNNGKGNGKD